MSILALGSSRLLRVSDRSLAQRAQVHRYVLIISVSSHQCLRRTTVTCNLLASRTKSDDALQSRCRISRTKHAESQISDDDMSLISFTQFIPRASLCSVSLEPPPKTRLLRLSAVALVFLSVSLSHSYPSHNLNSPPSNRLL